MKPEEEALLAAGGDLFRASRKLGISPTTLDTRIRQSADLQAFVAALATARREPEYDRISADQFEAEITRLARLYRLEATEIIYGMATMEFDSAAMAEVKLKAAIQLKGSTVGDTRGGELASVLEDLNRRYQEDAPRIKSIRVAQLDFEN